MFATHAKVLTLRSRFRLMRLEFLLAQVKEYDAPWLDSGVKVSRDPSTGKFASKSSGDGQQSAFAQQVQASLHADIDRTQTLLPQSVLDTSKAEIDRFVKDDVPWAEPKLNQVRDRLGHLDQSIVNPQDFTPEQQGFIAQAGKAILDGFDAFRAELKGLTGTVGERLKSMKGKIDDFTAGHAHINLDGRLVGMAAALAAETAIITGYVKKKLPDADTGEIFREAAKGALQTLYRGMGAPIIKEAAQNLPRGRGAAMKAIAFIVGSEVGELLFWAFDSFHRWQIDHNLPDARHIPADESKARKVIKAAVEKLDKPNVMKVAMIRPQIIGGHTADASAEKPRPMYQVSYEGVDYAAESKDALVESAAYYSARIKRYPERLRKAVTSVTMAGSFVPEWATNLMPFRAGTIDHGGLEGLLKGRMLAYTYTDPKTRPITLVSDQSGRPYAGADTLSHESFHALGSLLYGFGANPVEKAAKKLAEKGGFGTVSIPKGQLNDYALAVLVRPHSKISPYSLAGNQVLNYAEDFAEAGREYLQNPERLKKLEPGRYAVIDRLLKDPNYKG